jgi:hypothetical protein
MGMRLDQAIVEAIELAESVHGDDLDPVFAALEDRIDHVSREVDLMTLLPGGPNAALGMAIKGKDAQGFYSIFKARLRANLCARDGEFSGLIREGFQGSVGAVVSALAITLSLPAAALPLLVPLAVIICHSGLEAFCEAGSAPA